jgi:uncharacterized protein (DUF488 family)
MADSKRNSLYTIGHSNHTIEDFVRLLKLHQIEAIADVRSAPYSRYCPQFNKDNLTANLKAADIEYIFLGGELGGKPKDKSCYENGRVNLKLIAERKEFKQGLELLSVESLKHRIAIMCAEKDPLRCHRTFLICRHIRDNFHIRHIMADGTIEEHTETEHRLLKMLKTKPTLFEPAKTDRELIEQAYDEVISHEN